MKETAALFTFNRAGIEKLVNLTPRTARILSGNEERIVPAEEVKIGDIIRILPGKTIPVDGVIIQGSTSVNEAVMTGESLPVDKSAGDEVKIGCLPENKLEYIDEYEKAGFPVCMIGDGINDAPALKKASVGIAMGGAGSDIAALCAAFALIVCCIKERKDKK